MRTIIENLMIHFQKSEHGTDPNEEIPDGFYLVSDSENPKLEWAKAILDSVRAVTHIAPPDAEGNILGVPIS